MSQKQARKLWSGLLGAILGALIAFPFLTMASEQNYGGKRFPGSSGSSSWDATAGIGLGSGYATLSAIGATGAHIQSFDDTTDQSIRFRGVIPASYDTAGNITLEVHWASEDQTSGDVLWAYQVEVTAEDALVVGTSSLTAATNVTSAANTTAAGRIEVASWTVNNAAFDAGEPGDAFVILISRDADSSGTGTDDMTNDARLFRLVAVWP